MYKILLSLTLLVATSQPVIGQQRPQYEGRIERQYGALLDTLVAIMGHAPAAIRLEPYAGPYRGTTRGDTMIVQSEYDEHALLHELGHFWSMKEQRRSIAIADSLHFDPYTRNGAERLADIYSALLTTNR